VAAFLGVLALFASVTIFSDGILSRAELGSCGSRQWPGRWKPHALKLGARGETYDTAPRNRTKELFVAAPATFYTVFLVFAAGVDFLLLSLIIRTPGTILFVMSRREQNRRLFSPAELVILVIAVVGFVAGAVALATGAITT
jgi:arginine:ornithine antiporter/lysine permease